MSRASRLTDTHHIEWTPANELVREREMTHTHPHMMMITIHKLPSLKLKGVPFGVLVVEGFFVLYFSHLSMCRESRYVAHRSLHTFRMRRWRAGFFALWRCLGVCVCVAVCAVCFKSRGFPNRIKWMCGRWVMNAEKRNPSVIISIGSIWIWCALNDDYNDREGRAGGGGVVCRRTRCQWLLGNTSIVQTTRTRRAFQLYIYMYESIRIFVDCAKATCQVDLKGPYMPSIDWWLCVCNGCLCLCLMAGGSHHRLRTFPHIWNFD